MLVFVNVTDNVPVLYLKEVQFEDFTPSTNVVDYNGIGYVRKLN